MDGCSQALPPTQYAMEETLSSPPVWVSICSFAHLSEDRRELSDSEVGHSFFNRQEPQSQLCQTVSDMSAP